MEVLKHTSPTRVPVAPNDSPSKIRPSSRASNARIKSQCLARLCDPVELVIAIGRCWCEHDYEHEHEKPESKRSTRVFKLLPRRCRLGGSPVPFGNGRTTVARASDFQLRHAMFPRRDQASLLMKYRFGNLTCISNNAG